MLFFVPFCGIPLFLNVAGPNAFAALFPILLIAGVKALVHGSFEPLSLPSLFNLFAITWWCNLSIFARKCAHCGLLKFGDGDHA